MSDQSEINPEEHQQNQEEKERLPTPSLEQILPMAAWSTFKGTVVGATLGAGSRFITGPSTVVLGQPQVARQLLST